MRIETIEINDEKIEALAKKINDDLEEDFIKNPQFIDQGEVGAILEKSHYSLENLNSRENEILEELLSDEYSIYTYVYDSDYYSLCFDYNAYFIDHSNKVILRSLNNNNDNIEYSDLLKKIDNLDEIGRDFLQKNIKNSEGEILELIVIYNQLNNGEFNGIYNYSEYGASEYISHHAIGEENLKYFNMNEKDAIKKVESILGNIENLIDAGRLALSQFKKEIEIILEKNEAIFEYSEEDMLEIFYDAWQNDEIKDDEIKKEFEVESFDLLKNEHGELSIIFIS